MKIKSIFHNWIFHILISIILGYCCFSSLIYASDFDHIKWVIMSDAGYGYRQVDYEDLKAIGVDAVLDSVNWKDVETTSGVFDFTNARRSYERCRAAGLIWIPHLAVHYKPSWLCSNEYYYQYENGTFHTSNDVPPNYFHPQTQFYVTRFIEEFANAFSDVKSDIPLIFISICHLSESYYPGVYGFGAFDDYTISAWRSYTGNSSAMPYSSETANDGSGGTLEQFLDWWYNKMYEYITYTSQKVGEVLPYTKIGLKISHYPDLGQITEEQTQAVPASLRGVISFGGPTSQLSGLEKVGRVALQYNVNAWVESFLRDFNGKSNSIELTNPRLALNNISAMMYATILDLVSADWPPPAFQKKTEFYTYAQLIDEYDSYAQGFTTWYFAEGATLGSFDEYILIQNPTLNTANVKVTFMRSNGTTEVRYYTISGTSRYTIHVNDIVPNDSVSAKVESLNNVMIIAERAMYWDAGGVEWAGGHASTGVTSPSTTWYLAEGATLGSFDEWVLIQNPDEQTTAEVEVTFMKSNGSTVVRDIEVAPTSRYTIHVNDIVPNDSVSTKLVSTNGIGIIAERAMYWDSDGQHWKAGHCSVGVTNYATTWYLAEGATLGSFDEWVLIQNPNNETAEVEVTFMKSNGSTVVRNIEVAPTSRYTIHVNDIVPNDSVSTKLVSKNGIGIIAERAMYWDSDGLHWAGGHDSVGITSTGMMWFLAEGCTRGFDEWVLIQNPNSATAELKVTFMRTDGTVEKIDVSVPATSRYTIHVDDVYALDSADISTKVESTNGVGVIVERAMYWGSEGHASPGVK